MKILIIEIVFLLSILQLHECKVQKRLNFAASTESLLSSLKTVSRVLFEGNRTTDKTLSTISELNGDIDRNLEKMAKILNKIPFFHDNPEEFVILQDKFLDIRKTLFEAVNLKKRMDDNKIDVNERIVIDFRKRHEKVIDRAIAEIQRVFADTNVIKFFQSCYKNDSQIFENACEIGMSHLQFLDTVVGTIKLASIQYYIAKDLIFQFLERIGKGDFSISRNSLLEYVELKYSLVVKKFKNSMDSASTELWTCDPPNGFKDITRYQEISNTDFAELRLFSLYILSESNFASADGYCEERKCQAITKINNCSESDEVCMSTRKCPGELTKCEQVTYGFSIAPSIWSICANKNKNAIARYKSIEDIDSENKCHDGEVIIAKSSDFYYSAGNCHYCGCICHEQDYYISLQPIYSDYQKHNVITGAKLAVEDNVLHIQIQEGMLVSNGTIDKNTLRWKKMNTRSSEHREHKLSWNGLKEIDLTKSNVSNDRVVIGLTFKKSSVNRINFRVITAPFDFRSRSLLYKPAGPKKINTGSHEYDLKSQDVPTKSNEINIPQSTDNQYVTFKETSAYKDGGQTTIPFIDTQELVTNPPMPLSGAQLFIRGQKGYGGFLAMKLYTFDIRKYIDGGS